MSTMKTTLSHTAMLALGLALGYLAPDLWRTFEASRQLSQIEHQLGDDPSDADSWATLGVMSATAKDNERAITAFAKALQLDPANTTALIGIGNIAFEGGDYELAEKRYSEALMMAHRQRDASAIATADQLLKLVRAKRASSKPQSVGE